MKSQTDISIYFHVHLVSDSTGETLVAVMKASTAQFVHATALEHLHALVRTPAQMERTLEQIEARPGIVLYTLVNDENRHRLEQRCAELNMQAVSILDPTLATLGRYLGEAMSSEVGAQRHLDEQYYDRIKALDFAMAHDDGQNVAGLKDADVILLGVSRTSKTPTCIYLANRGIKAGNIPLVPGATLPKDVISFKKPLIVGLVARPERIAEIREQRLASLNETKASAYANEISVRDEMLKSKRLFAKHRWPTVDVSRRSIEETAARIINIYQEHKR
ncbi:pyruvate, water dikinase regulatory protein [Robiginitomaculum antarcticum]|uniref:pyruvate, water dikinase regulatory protein n=1 Tax=Robiginitomaculum antarcticum TaxID=437507 RepID=UPI00036A5413|nr:pyruvate, water dikinase regulatory protein [Robiginitomaculum antarcticum]